ncbi:MAG: hypothetical protein R3A80_02150 [Bdellovibrionota bacterium]
MTKTLVWNLGKLLQLIALIQAPYALYIGVSTNDARLELKYLMLAVVQFLLGLGLVQWSSKE